MTQGSESKPVDGTGNAVADLKAGHGVLSSAVEVGENFRKVTQPPWEERVVPVPGNSRWEDEAAYWRNRCLRWESGEDVAGVEQRDYWMARARRAEGALRQVSNLIAAVAKRVVKAEDILRGWRERTDG